MILAGIDVPISLLVHVVTNQNGDAMNALTVVMFAVLIIACTGLGLMIQSLRKRVYDLAVGVNQVCELTAKLAVRNGDRS